MVTLPIEIVDSRWAMGMLNRKEEFGIGEVI